MTNTPKNKHRPEYKTAHGPKQIKKTPSRAARKAARAAASPPPPAVNKRRRNIIVIASIVAVVLMVAAFAYYLIAVAPMQRAILTVGTEDISTGYFLKRMIANSSGDVTSTLQGLEGEYIIKQQAAAAGVLPVTDAAIDTYLRDQARTTYPDLTDAQYNKWFKDQLDKTGLSASEYRVVISHEIQRTRLTDILAKDMPAALPQYHVWAIPYTSLASATAAKAKLDAGADFAATATAVSTAAGGTPSNGDLDWWPLQLLPSQFVDTVQNAEIGVVSAPVTYPQTTSTGTTTSYVLIEVTAKEDSRTLTADQITNLKNNALLNWLNSKLNTYVITLHGLNGYTASGPTGTFDTYTTTYLNSEAQKLLNKRPSVTQTTATTSAVTTTPVTTATTATTP